MKKWIILIFLIISQMMLSQNLNEYRTLLKSGESSEKAAKDLIEKSTTAYKKTNKPLYAGFLAVGQFFMAKHIFNPLKKMKYFNDGKKTLEYAVKSDPGNLEIRLMRLITQEKAPRILGYTQNISEDRTFLTRAYKSTEDDDLKLYIKNYLKL